MQHNKTSRIKDIIKIYNGTGQYGFSIGNQEYRSEKKEDYLKIFSRALEIAKAKEEKKDFDVEEALRDSDTEEMYEAGKIKDSEEDACTCESCKE